MKKILILLLVLLMACGCSASKVDEGNAILSEEKDTTYFEYDNKKYTKNDVFQRLKAQSVASYLETVIAKQILDAENYDFQEDIDFYNEQYDSMESMYGAETVQQYYGDKESFAELNCLYGSISIYFVQYVKKRLSTFIEKYPSQYVEYITTTDEAKAKKFQKLVKKGSTFDEAVEKTEFENNENVMREVMTEDSATFPDEIKTIYSTLEVGKVSDVLKYTEEVEQKEEAATETTAEPTTTYYIINVISNDPENEYQDEFITFAIQKEGYSSLFDILNEDHTVNFYDDDFMYTYNKVTNN